MLLNVGEITILVLFYYFKTLIKAGNMQHLLVDTFYSGGISQITLWRPNIGTQGKTKRRWT